MNAHASLRRIKIVHTLVWAVFAASIVAIPVCASQRRFGAAAALVGFVMIEVLILMVNGMRCPLTGIAARYTADRHDNFDIYLPLCLARHNKTIFGTIYVAGVLYALVVWLAERAAT
ncbi:MAG: hypothetical protein K8H90_06565 [Thermoanaerobaculia bacterium]|nr:hypothetical protein [Thermoanaerobaculia bacterium]